MERSAVVINTLPFNISQSSYPHVAPKSTAREVSFSSSYLRPHHSKTSFEPPPSGLTQRVITADDAELSIFDAEKYFNETAEQRTPASQPPSMERIGEKSHFGRPSSVSSLDGCGRNHKAAPFHATPPASSEASWNSQSGLHSNPPGSMATTMRHIHLSNAKKCPNSPRRWFFAGNVPAPATNPSMWKRSPTTAKTAIPRTTLLPTALQVTPPGNRTWEEQTTKNRRRGQWRGYQPKNGRKTSPSPADTARFRQRLAAKRPPPDPSQTAADSPSQF